MQQNGIDARLWQRGKDDVQAASSCSLRPSSKPTWVRSDPDSSRSREVSSAVRPVVALWALCSCARSSRRSALLLFWICTACAGTSE